MYVFEAFLLGSYDPADFDDIDGTANRVVGKAFFLLLTGVILILLLNLLIALLSDSYEEVHFPHACQFRFCCSVTGHHAHCQVLIVRS